MKYLEQQRIRNIKKVKIPNRAREGCSVVFESMKENPFEIKAAAQITLKQSPKHSPVQKRQNRLLREQALERIKLQYPLEIARQFNSKKKRRAVKSQFTDNLEFMVFCEYTKSVFKKDRKVSRAGRTKIHQRKKREKSGGRLAYDTYIHSDIWNGVKNRYYQNNARQCVACLSYKKIHLHHMVYGQFGQEPDEHLITLCEEHHNQYHRENGTQRHMIRSTLEFIEKIRDELSIPH